MELDELVNDMADGVMALDDSRRPFKSFQPGAGPYGEPQLVAEIVRQLNLLPRYHGTARTKRTPDLLIPDQWAVEIKIARPYGDNGREAENWSVNLLHPYPGNTSSIGDCLKLLSLSDIERKAVVVIGYEHTPPQVDLMALVLSFEAVAEHVMGIELGERREVRRCPLVHPIHQCVRVFAWEVIGQAEPPRSSECLE